MQTDIFAVIWQDMIPLSLHCESAANAIDKAQAMRAKAETNGISLHDLRAIHLTKDDKLITLWRA